MTLLPGGLQGELSLRGRASVPAVLHKNPYRHTVRIIERVDDGTIVYVRATPGRKVGAPGGSGNRPGAPGILTLCLFRRQREV